VTRPITASLLYNYLACPHRVFLDSFGNPALRDPISPFVQLLWDKGTIFEKEVIAGLGGPFVDLSGLAGAEKEAATRASIERGDTLIYSGRLTVDELLGEPDLLRKEGAGYVAIDIKSGGGLEGGDEEEEGKPKKHYGVQLALYTDMLERLGQSAGRYGYIYDVHGKEIRYQLDAPRGPKSPSIAQLYAETKAAVERTLSGEAATRPALSSREAAPGASPPRPRRAARRGTPRGRRRSSPTGGTGLPHGPAPSTGPWSPPC